MPGRVGYGRLVWEDHLVKNPLDSLTGTIVCGILLTIVLYFVVKALQPVAGGS